jgi:hypothetical protein
MADAVTRWAREQPALDRLLWWLKDWAPFVDHTSRVQVDGAWQTVVRREWLTPLGWLRCAWHRLSCDRCRIGLPHGYGRDTPWASNRAVASKTLALFARKDAAFKAREARAAWSPAKARHGT